MSMLIQLLRGKCDACTACDRLASHAFRCQEAWLPAPSVPRSNQWGSRKMLINVEAWMWRHTMINVEAWLWRHTIMPYNFLPFQLPGLLPV
jgi:hypothetical protein